MTLKVDSPFLIMTDKKQIVVALDGTGGDKIDPKAIAKAIRFATVMVPELKVKLFGEKKLEEAVIAEKVKEDAFEFVHANQSIPQDEDPRSVLEHYLNSAMARAIYEVKDGNADAIVSSGGTGPLVALSRHILGCPQGIRPALCAKLPAGPDKFTLMLDLGANASINSKDLVNFAKLGSIAYENMYDRSRPSVALLNIGVERNKGNNDIKAARDILEQDRELNFTGFIEANKLFCDEANVIITDGFSGNIALKAAEGVASIFTSAKGMQGFFVKLSWPTWLTPWQYNGAVLLGLNALVIKSHASADQGALGVALVEAARYAKLKLSEKICSKLATSV